MARTTKVGLDVDEKPFVRGMKRAEDAADGVKDALDDVADSARDTTVSTEKASESTDDLGDSARDAGRDLNSLRHDAARLDRQIDETTSSIRDLAREIARTADEAERAQLTERLTGERARLRGQVDLRKLIDFDSAQMSAGFAAQLGRTLTRAMGSVGPGAAIGAPLVAGVASVVGAAVAGAIVGGVGIGGIAGGLALAARDEQVKAAATDLGADLGDMFGRASASFVPVTLKAIADVRSETLALEGDWRRLFSAASDLVDPLLDGLIQTGKNALPGIIDAIEAADPVIEGLADGLAGIGDALGDGLSGLAEYADEGGRALRLLLGVVEGGTRLTLGFVESMTRLYGAGEIVGAVLSGDLPRAIQLMTAEEINAAGASNRLSGTLFRVGDGAERAARKTAEMADALDQLNGLQLDANAAENRFQEAIDRAREAMDGKVSSIDRTTEQGRLYSQSLDDIATGARTSAQAIYDQTQSTDAANAKIMEGRAALIAQARQYGLSKTEARRYADSILAVPTQWKTNLDANTADAIKRVKKYAEWLRTVNLDKTSTIYQRLVTEQNSARGGHKEFLSGGGYVDGPGPKGVDSVDAVLAPGEGVFTAREVDMVGGRAGFEALRSALRSGSQIVAGPLLGGAQRYGTAPAAAPALAGGGGGIAVDKVIVQAWTDRFSLRQVEQELAMQGTV